MSGKFEAEIELGNAAFEGDNRRAEVARILRVLAERVEQGQENGVVYDVNGNLVGNWYLDPADEEDS